MTSGGTAASDASPATVEVAGLGKRYPGVVALDSVSLSFSPGTATAVLGENGAGKSTLVSILAGLQKPDSGEVHVAGRRVRSFTPDVLLHDHRVALVPQEIALCRDRSVAENVMLGHEGGLFPSRHAMVADTRLLLDGLGMRIDPRRRAGQLSVAEQQMVLIARALARDCRVVILDEPTTSLTPREVNHLFGVLRGLRSDGRTIIYISHRMPEIFELCEHVHVLRDGRHVASFLTAEVTADRLVATMVGRNLTAPKARPAAFTGMAALEVDSLSGPGFSDVTFNVAPGEIVGVAGLPDSGRSELVAGLFGATRNTGSVLLHGAPIRLHNPRQAIRQGIGYVPAERRSQGVFPDMSVAVNATILDLDRATRYGVVGRRRLRRLADERLRHFDVRGSVGGSVAGLSGGNQQKVILSRWLSQSPRLLLLDDPTRGVDVGAKADIHDRIAVAAASGAAVVMASSDLPELLHACDRILVMAEGRVAGVVARHDATEELVMALATGTPPPPRHPATHDPTTEATND